MMKFFDMDYKRVLPGMEIQGHKVVEKDGTLYLERCAGTLSGYGKKLEGTDIIILPGMRAELPKEDGEPTKAYLVQIVEETSKAVIVHPKERDLELYDVDEIAEEMCNKGIIDLEKNIYSYSRECETLREVNPEDVGRYEEYWEE